METPLVTRISDNLYSIPSFSGSSRVPYLVDTLNGTCNCPHHRHRGAVCKHIRTARKQREWLYAVEKARTCNDQQIDALLVKYTRRGDTLVSGALRCVRAERRKR